METTPASTEEILLHHLNAFRNNDINEIMKDYSEQSEVWGPDGAMVGLNSITSFYSYVFTLLPTQNAQLNIKQQIVKEDKAYIAWNADSTIINIPIGTDSFHIKDGKILWQSLAAHIIPKPLEVADVTTL